METRQGGFAKPRKWNIGTDWPLKAPAVPMALASGELAAVRPFPIAYFDSLGVHDCWKRSSNRIEPPDADSHILVAEASGRPLPPMPIPADIHTQGQPPRLSGGDGFR